MTPQDPQPNPAVQVTLYTSEEVLPSPWPAYGAAMSYVAQNIAIIPDLRRVDVDVHADWTGTCEIPQGRPFTVWVSDEEYARLAKDVATSATEAHDEAQAVLADIRWAEDPGNRRPNAVTDGVQRRQDNLPFTEPTSRPDLAAAGAEAAPECVECVARGIPTEGMTGMCPDCQAIVCAAHMPVHAKLHGHTDVPDEEPPRDPLIEPDLDEPPLAPGIEVPEEPDRDPDIEPEDEATAAAERVMDWLDAAESDPEIKALKDELQDYADRGEKPPEEKVIELGGMVLQKMTEDLHLKFPGPKMGEAPSHGDPRRYAQGGKIPAPTVFEIGPKRQDQDPVSNMIQTLLSYVRVASNVLTGSTRLGLERRNELTTQIGEAIAESMVRRLTEIEAEGELPRDRDAPPRKPAPQRPKARDPLVQRALDEMNAVGKIAEAFPPGPEGEHPAYGHGTVDCQHDSRRADGKFDNHCLRCGKDGYWRNGVLIASSEGGVLGLVRHGIGWGVEGYPSGKLLLLDAQGEPEPGPPEREDEMDEDIDPHEAAEMAEMAHEEDVEAQNRQRRIQRQIEDGESLANKLTDLVCRKGPHATGGQRGAYHTGPFRENIARALEDLRWEDPHETQAGHHQVEVLHYRGAQYVELADAQRLIGDAERQMQQAREANEPLAGEARGLRTERDALAAVLDAVAGGDRLLLESWKQTRIRASGIMFARDWHEERLRRIAEGGD